MTELKATRIRADFNGLFGDMLCLSHEETCPDAEGNLVTFREGMSETAFDKDIDEFENRDDLIACGTVEHSPESLRCHGSRWILRIDSNRVRHESELGINTLDRLIRVDRFRKSQMNK
jgi:hypothetical protein